MWGSGWAFLPKSEKGKLSAFPTYLQANRSPARERDNNKDCFQDDLERALDRRAWRAFELLKTGFGGSKAKWRQTD